MTTRRWAALLAGIALAAGLLAAGPAAAASRHGRPPHVMVLMMENEGYGDVVGNPGAPYQNHLAKTYEVATRSYGVGHYSLDNYLAAVSGRFFPWSAFDCTPGSGCQASGPTIASQLDAARIPWAAYMGSMPKPCDTANDDEGTVAASYGVRHDPFVYFPALVRHDCAKIQPSRNMLGELDAKNPPAFVWYTPSICHDAGNDDACATLANGDAFLSQRIPAIQRTRWYRDGGVIVLTYDEGNRSGQGPGEHLNGEGNHVLTVLISAATAHKAPDKAYVNHFGLLASLEKAYHLHCLAQACVARNGRLPLP